MAKDVTKRLTLEVALPKSFGPKVSMSLLMPQGIHTDGEVDMLKLSELIYALAQAVCFGRGVSKAEFALALALATQDALEEHGDPLTVATVTQSMVDLLRSQILGESLVKAGLLPDDDEEEEEEEEEYEDE